MVSLGLGGIAMEDLYQYSTLNGLCPRIASKSPRSQVMSVAPMSLAESAIRTSKASSLNLFGP